MTIRQALNADAHLQESTGSVHDDEMNGQQLIEILHKILEQRNWTQGDLAAELEGFPADRVPVVRRVGTKI
jgi:hypothetical protein